jgi:uncharacterized metal-binding protein
MTQQGYGQMFCLAGIGGGVEPVLKKAAAAQKILAIDGCPLNCVKHCLEEAGFQQFSHLQLADIGMEKGKTPATDENIERAVIKGRKMLA